METLVKCYTELLILDGTEVKITIHKHLGGTWAQDGGALMNQCIHNIDLLRWMMGDEITEVCAYTDNLNHDYIQAEDLGIAIVKFKNGAYGIIEGTTDVYPKKT